MPNCIAIIPARYDSTRLPGKMLERIGNMTLLERVYRQVERAREPDRIIIATDDDRIAGVARDFGADVEMTFRSHPSGTDRCAQVARNLWEGDIVLNVQGDEPFIEPGLIDMLARKMKEDDWITIGTCRTRIRDRSDRTDASTVKVVCDHFEKALYFSRAGIPFSREAGADLPDMFKHIGLYGFRNKILQEITALPPSGLETTEKLEQLRWLENGYAIYAFLTDYEALSIDTPEDLARARQRVLETGGLGD